MSNLLDAVQLLNQLSGYGSLRKKPKFARKRTRLRPPRYINNIVRVKNIIGQLERRRRSLKQPPKRPLKRPRINAQEVTQLARTVLRPSLPFFQHSVTSNLNRQIPVPSLNVPVQAAPAPVAEVQVPAEAAVAVAPAIPNVPAPQPNALDQVAQTLEEVKRIQQERDNLRNQFDLVPGQPAAKSAKAMLADDQRFFDSLLEDLPDYGDYQTADRKNLFATPERKDLTLRTPSTVVLPTPQAAAAILDSSMAPSMTSVDDGMTGTGKTIPPISNFGLERLLAPYRQDGFVGVIASDQIMTLQKYVNRGDILAFIMNLSPSGTEGTHWIAVWINFTNNKYGAPEVDYFDPLGDPAKPETIKDLMALVSRRIGFQVLPKFKENRIRQQRLNSNTCGYIAAQFLRRMFAGEDFAEATNYTISKSEDEARKLLVQEKQVGGKKFGYLMLPPPIIV